jgi:cytochrome c oxidase cbb3-type subunit 2
MPSYPYLFETKAAAEPGDEVEAAAGPRPRKVVVARPRRWTW